MLSFCDRHFLVGEFRADFGNSPQRDGVFIRADDEEKQDYNMTTNLHQNGNGMMMRPVHRVVITGMGAITPLALTIGETWEALLAGRSGIGPITHFDASELKTRFAGQVKNFDPENYMERKEARRTDPFIQFAVAASREAVADSASILARSNPIVAVSSMAARLVVCTPRWKIRNWPISAA